MEGFHEAHPLETAAKETVRGKVREAEQGAMLPADLQILNIGHSPLWGGSPCTLSGLQKTPRGLTHSSQAQGL